MTIETKATEQAIQYKFPENFFWGTASSAPQMEGSSTEGGKLPSIWDHWFMESPERFHNGVGPKNTSKFYENYKTDISLMKELGHNSFRTSIAWSRLMKEDGSVNEEAVTFYNKIINEMIENGVEPFINLFHFDMPMYLQEKGGWESREVVAAYEQFAATAFKLFGDRVKKWFAHNEPIVPVEGGYLYNFHYPCVIDFKRAIQVGYHTALSTALAIRAFRGTEQCKDGEIGVIVNLTPSYPRSNSPEDVAAADLADSMFNRSFLDPAIHGTFPKDLVALFKEHDLLPVTTEEDLEVIRHNTIDLLGVNYYQPRRIQARETAVDPNAPLMPETFFDNYVWPERKMNPYRGWEIYEKAIYDLSINLRDNYDNIPYFISENGMGVEGEERYIDENGQIHDDYRIEFIQDHLVWLHKAIEEGCNCKGYHLWTFIDNWSWTNAYKNRYGFVALDLDTFKRTPKKSAYWFKEVTENNGF